MLFATVLGILLGAAAALLIEQWLRDELGAATPAVQPRLARSGRAPLPSSIALRRLPPR